VLPSPSCPGEYLPTALDPESSVDADGGACLGLVPHQPHRLGPTRGVEDRAVIRFGDEAIREEEGRWDWLVADLSQIDRQVLVRLWQI